MDDTTNEIFTAVVSGVRLTKQYPFLIKDYNDLPNEEWLEIPNTNGYYHVSNLGRIKSIDREIQRKDGTVAKYKGKVLTQSILKLPNYVVGDFVYELTCTIRFESTIKTISLNRVIYSLFVEPLNFNEDKLVILHKNNDKLDNRVENLYTGTLNEKAKQIYAKKRGHKVSSYITEDKRKIGIINRYKSVSQYIKTGEKIGFYKCIKEASKKTKINESSIVAACKRKQMLSAGGYLWQYGNGSFTIDVTYYNKYIEKSKEKAQQKISQFTIKGEIIKTYNSIALAEKATEIKAANIGSCINGHTYTAGGFIWKKGIYKKKIDTSNSYQNILNSLKNKKKPLLQICPISHKVINTFTCSGEAAKYLNIKSSKSLRVAAVSKKVVANFLWRFK